MASYRKIAEPSSLIEAAELLEQRQLSSQELCQALLHRVDEVDEQIGAFREINHEYILNLAKESDARRQRGEPLSRFDGIPIAIKDNITVKGLSCCCASRILEGFRATYDATAVARLRAAGLIPFGRTNMDEFAMGSTGEYSAWRPTRNPANPDHVPGGSSSGSAAAVASGQAIAALGSDTGGSIRQPAGYCGVLGLKPTYGFVSRYGLVAFASSLDQIGPICRSADDAAILLDIIGGKDPHDSTSLPDVGGSVHQAMNDFNVKGLRIGLPKEFFDVKGLDPEVRTHVEQVRDRFLAAGAEAVEVHLPHLEYAVAVYYIIATAEASSNLSRFDGIRYGARIPDPSDLHDIYYRTRARGFGDEVKRRIILGTYVLSAGYYDAYYLRAQKIRTLLRQDFQKAYTKCDIILAPLAPTTAPPLHTYHDPLAMYLADIYTIPVNLTGMCSVAVPGKDAANGLPLSVQIMSDSLCEGRILAAAKWLQQQEGN